MPQVHMPQLSAMTRFINATQIGLASFLSIFLIAFLAVLLCCSQPAYARGGCFGAGTEILTSDGYQVIKQLSETTHLVGWTFSENHLEVENIGETQVSQADDY